MVHQESSTDDASNEHSVVPLGVDIEGDLTVGLTLETVTKRRQNKTFAWRRDYNVARASIERRASDRMSDPRFNRSRTSERCHLL